MTSTWNQAKSGHELAPGIHRARPTRFQACEISGLWGQDSVEIFFGPSSIFRSRGKLFLWRPNIFLTQGDFSESDELLLWLVKTFYKLDDSFLGPV